MPKASTLKRVMYISKARHKMSQGELKDMLAGARIRNDLYGITGILIYDSGNFAQVLEGPAAAIDGLLESIRDDPRHADYVLLSEAMVDERYFEGWAMDYANLDKFGDGSHDQLRRYLADHTIADRETIYRALVIFIEAYTSGGRPGSPAGL